MDQFVVDVGDAEIAAGDEVVLFGPGAGGEPTAQDWADALDTIHYEIVTRVGAAGAAQLHRRRLRRGCRLMRIGRAPAIVGGSVGVLTAVAAAAVAQQRRTAARERRRIDVGTAALLTRRRCASRAGYAPTTGSTCTTRRWVRPRVPAPPPSRRSPCCSCTATPSLWARSSSSGGR